MQKQRRVALLTLSAELGLKLRAYWVREWIKEPGIYRGRREGRLKYYWLQGEILHSGPFYGKDEALLFLEQNLPMVCVN